MRLNNGGRRYRTPRVPDCRVRICGCLDEIQQLAVHGLGDGKPTLLLTYQKARPGQLTERCTRPPLPA